MSRQCEKGLEMDDLIKESVDWITARPYLKGLGELHIAIYEAMFSASIKSDGKPDLEAFKKSMDKGVSLFEAAGSDFLDFEAAGKIFAALAGLHENKALPEKFRNECLVLEKAVAGNATVYEKILRDMLTADGDVTEKFAAEKGVNADLPAFFAWSSLRGVLKPYLEELAEAQKAWVFGHCPTCGAEPVTSYLKRTSRGRERFLSCAHCGTGWSYKRIGCPYCGNDIPKMLSIKEVDGEKNFRIDVCDKCKSYIKTGVDKGSAELGREDWATAHLDILCDDTEYKKHGGLFVWK